MAKVAIIIDPPGVEPALAISIPTLHGKEFGEVITLATARDLVRELQASLDTIEKSG